MYQYLNFLLPIELNPMGVLAKCYVNLDIMPYQGNVYSDVSLMRLRVYLRILHIFESVHQNAVSQFHCT